MNYIYFRSEELFNFENHESFNVNICIIWAKIINCAFVIVWMITDFLFDHIIVTNCNFINQVILTLKNEQFIDGKYNYF